MGRYAVKAIFDTLQGEGIRTGMRSVFVRFSGCNLWDGHPLHRDLGHSPCAQWCDTDFAKGTVLDQDAILDQMDQLWPPAAGVERWCVLTGGEPTLQMDEELLGCLRSGGWRIAVETNGSNPCNLLVAVDHVAVSPKRGVPLVIDGGTELKVVLPGSSDLVEGWTDEELERLARSGVWQRKFVQPQDILLAPNLVGVTALVHDSKEARREAVQAAQASYQAVIRRCVSFVETHPDWALSIQTNKILGLP